MLFPHKSDRDFDTCAQGQCLTKDLSGVKDTLGMVGIQAYLK